ncbi:MAG: PfkB family carbohydrate kinase [Myxococcota bacterium]
MSGRSLDVVGIGSMVVDRLHRSPRILQADQKGLLRRLDSGEVARRFVGGVVLNHLGWAAALGLRTGIFGRQADDAEGRFLREAMDRLGIERQLVLDGEASSTAEIFVDDSGARAIYMAPGATAETDAAHIRDHHAGFIRRGARLSTEVSQLPLEAVLAALGIAREAGLPTVVDLDVPPSDAVPALGTREQLEAVLAAADLLKPAKAAARALLPQVADDAGDLARALAERYEAAVVITDGAAGCAVAAPDFEGWVPAHAAKEVVDTTGAGDAFLGGLLVGLHHGLDLPEAASLANACGAACVERLGAFPEDPAAARARVLDLYEGPAFDLGPLPAGSRRGTAAEALGAFDVSLEELSALRRRLAPESFERATALIREAVASGSRVHVTGVGKPEHVAHYAASLLASTGTPATFLHATEAVHGSAGQVMAGDVLIAISNSGDTADLRRAAEAARALGARLVGVTGNRASWLGREAEVVLDAGVAREGGGLGLAPRASVAAEMVVLAALSAALETASGLTTADYHARHPSGALGARSRRES